MNIDFNMNINKKNDVTGRYLPKDNHVPKNSKNKKLKKNNVKKENNNYIKDLMEKIKKEQKQLTNLNQLNEQILLGLIRINDIKTKSDSILDIKNQFIDPKFKQEQKYQDIILLLNGKLKPNNDYDNKIKNLISLNKNNDKIDTLINLVNNNYKVNHQEFIEPKLYFQKMLPRKHSKAENLRSSMDKLYVSCIDGKFITNGKRSEIKCFQNNVSRKSSNASVSQKSKYFEDNSLISTINEACKNNNNNLINIKGRLIKNKSGLNVLRKYELFNKDYYNKELNQIEFNLLKF